MAYYYNAPILTDAGVGECKDVTVYPEPTQSLSAKSEAIESHSTRKTQTLSSLLKVSLLIFIFFLELAPFYTIQIYSTMNEAELPILTTQICLFLADLVPLTNTFIILFIHEETHQELAFLKLIWKNRIMRKVIIN